jgi:CBS domain containing-hemolysin-like protein
VIEAILLLGLGILVIAVIIAANGYFVAQEFTYMSVDRARLRAGAEAGDPRSRRALAVTRRTSFMLSGAQLGITVTGLLVGYFAEPLVGESLGTLLGGVGIDPAVSIVIGTTIALVVAAVVQMIFGELFPKNLAIANPEPLARALARSTTIYLAAFGWLIVVFDKAANALLRLIRIEPVHDVDSSASALDLEHLIDNSRASGDLPQELSLMLDRIFDFPRRDVEHAMIPRSRVGTVDPDTTIDEVRHLMAGAHSRYPVLDADDAPIGVVQLFDVLSTALPGSTGVAHLMRTPLVLPTAMPLPDALSHLTRSQNELACVIDEYGGFVGVVTIEDLAEELVGEITDEHDPDAPTGVSSDDDGVWIMDGDVHIDEVERAIAQELPRGDFETIAGLLIAQRGSLPSVGETVVVPLPVLGADLVEDEPVRRRLEADVIAVERHVPSQIRVRIVEGPLHPGEADLGASGAPETTDPAENPDEVSPR